MVGGSFELPPIRILKYPALKGRVSAGGRMKYLLINTLLDLVVLQIRAGILRDTRQFLQMF